MFTNLHLFNDFSKFEKRKTATQEEFEKENFHFMVEFSSIAHEALCKVHRHVFTVLKPNEMDRNLVAVSMISFIRQGLISAFPTYCRNATTSRFVLTTPSNENVFVKKLNKNKRPSNIATISNDMILCQVTDCVEDDRPNIFLGYTINDDNSQITGTYAVCIEGKDIIWITDISTLGNSNQAIVVNIKPSGGAPALKEGIVKIKNTKTKNE